MGFVRVTKGLSLNKQADSDLVGRVVIGKSVIIIK